MKLDALTVNNGLPEGLQRLAVLSNRTLRARKWRRWLTTVPNGIACGRSFYTQQNIVVLAEDAIRGNLPTVDFCYLTISRGQASA